MNSMTGGDFGSGFLSGSLSSLAATGAHGLLGGSNSNFVRGAGTIGSGAVAGGVGSVVGGGSFWDGARNGAISSGLNHGIHTGALGEGLMMAAITGRTRHFFGPIAIAISATGDVSSGVNVGIEKGKLIVLRGKENGIYDLNDLSVGGVSASVGVEGVKMYTSTAKVLKRHFYGNRYEANLSISGVHVNIGGTGIFARHQNQQDFTIGYGFTIGLNALPFNIGFNLNSGATTEYFQNLTPEVKKAFSKW